jgi:MOSC domain-containing protein YiiM
MTGVVTAVASNETHALGKPLRESIRLVPGQGVEGDCHLGATVQHRSRVARDPTQPNLRQVHLIHSELLDELKVAGFDVGPGEMGENVTTRGIDLIGLPAGSLLRLGDSAVVEVTGLRNPCVQLDGLRQGLMQAMRERNERGELVRKLGVMAIVRVGGVVRAGDGIRVEWPAGEHRALDVV